MTPASVVVGTGLDLQPLARAARLLDDHASDLHRVFTREERTCCDRHRRWRLARYAAAFAAKEAVMKALGSGWSADVDWAEINTAPAPAGAVRLQGGAARLAARARIQRVLVSTAVTRSAALATALALGRGDD